MVQAQQIAEFQARGCLLGGPLLDAAQVAELRDELDQVIGGRAPAPLSLRNLSGDDAAPVWQVVNIWQVSAPFQRLATLPALGRAAAALLGVPRVRLWHDQIQYKPPRHGGVNGWHQDAPFWKVLRGDQMLTAWIPLDDATAENGCMSMVPGSHRWGRHWDDHLSRVAEFDAVTRGFTPPEGERAAVELRPVPQGHVSWHHALTWHGSHGNGSERPRRAIAVHFMAAETRYDAAGEHPCKAFITAADGEPVTGEAFPLVG